MAGYRCVNFSDLCRLCSNASNNNTQIFSNEELQKKIAECLPIQLDEKDKLPKSICAGCKEYVEIFSDFRKSTQTAQKMLEGCLNSSKIRNGGQVYIRDEPPAKKVLKPIQNPSPTKLVPNLNLIASPSSQLKKISSPSQPDFLGAIMQQIGIQAGEENMSDTNTGNVQKSASIQGIPQYTLTLDGNGQIKGGQIQYKIENSNVIGSEELMKLKNKPGLIVRKESPQIRLAATEEAKNKKPKFNFIIQSPPSNQKQAPKVQAQQIIATSTPKATLTSPSKAQILNIEKIAPATSQTSPTKQLLVPIMVRSDGTRNTLTAGADASQIIQQALQMSANQASQEVKPAQPNQPFMLMKIQSGADGQFTLMPATPIAQPQPQQLQLSLSPQQMQQLGLQTQPTISMQSTQMTIPTQITHTSMAPSFKLENQTTQTIKETVIESVVEEETYEDNYDENYYGGDDNESLPDETVQEEEKTQDEKKEKKKSSKFTKKPKAVDNYEEPPINPEHSEMAKKQMAQITNYNAKKNPDESDAKSDYNLTVCDVCKKIFKRKEFLMQHLKSHIGIRPFKCDEPSCNKSFSRKEHLLRHVSSHTGKKEYQCNICSKMFSRKDNLNKHRRIHPESGQSNLRHCCPNCEEGFSYKAQLQKHMQTCDYKPEETSPKPKKASGPQAKKSKLKQEPEQQKVIHETTQNVVQMIQQPSQVKTEQPQQVLISLQQLGRQQQNRNITYMPIVLNPN